MPGLPDCVWQSGLDITFTLDRGTGGEQVLGTAATSSSGIAAFTVPGSVTSGLLVGPHVIRASFAGSTTLVSGSADTPWTIVTSP